MRTSPRSRMAQKMEKLQKKPNRLKDYDYSRNGYYFITICVKDRQEILWEPTVDDAGARIARPQLSAADRITEVAIINVPSIYRFIDVDNAESASIVIENQ